MKTRKSIIILALLTTLLPTLLWARTNDNRPSGERRSPPQEAFDACSDKKEGDEVEVRTPRGRIKATCRQLEGELVAIPDGPPPPPPEGGNAPQ